MDINSSKKTLLSLINGGILGAPSANQTVKFQYATSIATAAASTTAGALTFAADSNGNAAIYAQGTLVSSKIQNVAAAAASGAKHGGKTITVTYIGDAGSIQTATFDVIDEAALEAYFTGSKTIALDSSTDLFEVKVDGATILVDESNGLKTGLNIAYIAESGDTGATIALRDSANTVLSSINVSDIVGDGVLVDSIYHSDTNILELRFGNGHVYDPTKPGTYTKVEIDMQALIDVSDVFIANDSSIYLDATLDASTVTLHTKMQDPSTAAADATGLADAWKVKQYVDSKSTELAVEAESRDTYLDASVLAANNKKVWVAAQVADLTVAAGVAGGNSDSSLSGTSGKLVDAADAASKVQSFVNARLSEEVAKLDASIDSTGHTFIEVGVAEVDGKVTSVVVHETIGSITGTASDLSGTTGLIDGADAATAVKTYVDGQIAALDSSVADETADEYISIAIEAANGKLTSAEIDYTKSTVTFDDTPGALDLTATDGILTSDAIAEIKGYVDAKSGALDSSVEDTDDGKGYVYVKTVQSDGALSQQIVNVTYGEITATPGAIQIDNNGIIDSSVLKEAVEGALTWTVLS